MKDFDDLTKTLSALTDNFTANNLSKMNNAAAKVLRKANAARIRANQTPDGAQMTPRANLKPFIPSKAARFLYPSNGNGTPRLVQLNSWTISGALIIGFDTKKGAKRHFVRKKIIKWLPNTRPEIANNSATPFKAKPKSKGRMFKKLPKPEFFKIQANSLGFRIGFTTGKAAILANIHHYGEPKRRIPARELLGVAKGDEELLLEEYIKNIDF